MLIRSQAGLHISSNQLPPGESVLGKSRPLCCAASTTHTVDMYVCPSSMHLLVLLADMQLLTKLHLLLLQLSLQAFADSVA